MSDLTDHRQIEKKLIETETAFNLTQRMAHIGNWHYDLVEDKMYWSDEFYRILGFKPTEREPSLALLLQAVCPEDRERISKTIKEVGEIGKLVNMEYPIIRADGTVCHIHAEIQALYDPDGNLVKLFGTVQDVTSARRAEATIREAKKEAELYVDLLSHDINNINQAAIGYAELAIQAMEHGDYDLSLLDRTIEMLHNSSSLINNVRTIQRIKAGEIQPESIDIGPLIDGVIGQYDSVKGRKVMINSHTEYSCKVMASELIREVFSNLIDNAIKHSTGVITIDIKLSMIHENGIDYCKVAVSDNGPGIPDEKKKVLFTRYMQGTTKQNGTGLGLYLVKSLIETFNGRVWAEDRVVGDYTKGSRFVVLLPLVDNSQDILRSVPNHHQLAG